MSRVCGVFSNTIEGDDFVLATGRTETVRKFIELAFTEIDRRIIWEGEGIEEVGRDAKTNKILVRVDPKYFRPSEVDLLIGNPAKAKRVLGWEAKIELEELASEMVKVALHNAKQPKHNLKLAEF